MPALPTGPGGAQTSYFLPVMIRETSSRRLFDGPRSRDNLAWGMLALTSSSLTLLCEGGTAFTAVSYQKLLLRLADERSTRGVAGLHG